jgi:hypothetical protein
MPARSLPDRRLGGIEAANHNSLVGIDNFKKGGIFMRKSAVLSAVLLFAFGLAFGMTITLSEEAMAEKPCPTACAYDLYCSYETGDNCTNPFQPYYMYRYNGICPGYPARYCPPDGFTGCCGIPGMWIYWEPRP